MNQKKINNKLPVAWEGMPFIITGVGLTSIALILGWNLFAIPFTALTLLTIYFFRDPERSHENIEQALLTPADGKILSIDRLDKGDSRFEGEAIKISIFMSIFDAHIINKMPVSERREIAVMFQVKSNAARFCPILYISPCNTTGSDSTQDSFIDTGQAISSRIVIIEFNSQAQGPQTEEQAAIEQDHVPCA